MEYNPEVLADVQQQMRTNFMGFAAFTMLVWDHIDTFADEVTHIWLGSKGPVFYLFLLNRYLTPLGFMINLYGQLHIIPPDAPLYLVIPVAYLSPVWTPEVCERFVRYEGAMTVIGINVAAIMMYLRIHALHNQNKPILAGVLALFIVELSVNAWLLAYGTRVPHHPESGIVACTMIYSRAVPGWLAASSAWLPLLYITVILALTVSRTLPSLNRRTSYVVTRLFVYYAAIFAVALVLTLMIIFAPPGIQNITAQLVLLLTVVMMSRITIHLSKSKDQEIRIRPELPSMFTQKSTMVPEPRVQIVTPGFNSNRMKKVGVGPTETMLSDGSSFNLTSRYHDGPIFNVTKRLGAISEASTHPANMIIQSPSGGQRESFVELNPLEGGKKSRVGSAQNAQPKQMVS